jgi:hypothetical protein
MDSSLSLEINFWSSYQHPDHPTEHNHFRKIFHTSDKNVFFLMHEGWGGRVCVETPFIREQQFFRTKNIPKNQPIITEGSFMKSGLLRYFPSVIELYL